MPPPRRRLAALAAHLASTDSDNGVSAAPVAATAVQAPQPGPLSAATVEQFDRVR